MFYRKDKEIKNGSPNCLDEDSITLIVDSDEEQTKFSYQLYGQDYKPK